MDSREEHADQRIERETAAVALECNGEGMITVGKALLGMDLILVCFVDIGFRTGSLLFLWWVLAEGILGLILIGLGVHRKSEAQRELNALEPR
jgi:hypothetical protein